MATLRSAFAFNLRRLLDSRETSQSDLARTLKVSIQTINGLVKERAGVSEQMIQACAAHFGVEETDLVRPPIAAMRADLGELIEYMQQIAWTPTRLEVLRSVLTGFATASEMKKSSQVSVEKLSEPRDQGKKSRT